MNSEASVAAAVAGGAIAMGNSSLVTLIEALPSSCRSRSLRPPG